MSNGVHTKDDLLRVLREHRDDLSALGVRRLGVFGSFVRGEQRPTSDVDLLVEFDAGLKTFDRFMQLCFLLEDALQRPVELVTIESLSPHVGPHIMREVEFVSLAA
jgi:predicted nucleotidyltransferase